MGISQYTLRDFVLCVMMMGRITYTVVTCNIRGSGNIRGSIKVPSTAVMLLLVDITFCTADNGDG